MDSLPESLCHICGASCNHVHFGVLTCRACAAFFRRTVALARRYECKREERCRITSIILDGRNMCRSCRFLKCLEKGMQVGAVQDIVRNNKKKQSAAKSDEEKPPAPTAPIAGNGNDCPLLSRLLGAYEHLESVRKVLYNTIEPMQFTKTKPEPHPMNLEEVNAMHRVELGLIVDFLMNSFADFSILPSSQMQNLYNNFFADFTLVESAYLTYLSGQTSVIFKQNGHYIDLFNPETFHIKPGRQSSMTTEQLISMNRSVYELLVRCIIGPMSELKIEKMEFLILVALVLCSSGVDEWTRETWDVVGRIRLRLLSEAREFYKRTVHAENAAMRLSQILLLISPLQKFVRRIAENMEIRRIFNVFPFDDTVYELLSKKF